jgi:hypothetical protein
MLTNNQIREILEEKALCCLNEAILEEEFLKKVVCCPFCKELFISPKKLTEHFKNNHQEQLSNSSSQRIAQHCVEKGDDEICICPHCFFAIGNNSNFDYTGGIYKHVEQCSLNTSRNCGLSHVSFKISSDSGIINKYISGKREILFLSCDLDGCNKVFGSEKNYMQHLLDHANASCEDLKKNQLEFIFQVGEEIFKKRKSITVPFRKKEQSSQVKERAKNNRGEFSKIITSEEVDRGAIKLNSRLLHYLSSSNNILIYYILNQKEASLPLNAKEKQISNLKDWFLQNNIKEGDIVRFYISGNNPLKIRMWTEWEKNINYIFHLPAEDLDWQSWPIRDCLMKIFSDNPGRYHYRTLYSKVSKHRNLAIGSVLSTLSKYNKEIFMHVGRGEWERVDYDVKKKSTLQTITKKIIEENNTFDKNVDEEIWKTVTIIEEKDIVYRLLKRLREPLSFVQICKKIAEYRDIDWNDLKHTGFIDLNDERIRRIKDGSFALSEWFDDILTEEAHTEEESHVFKKDSFNKKKWVLQMFCLIYERIKKILIKLKIKK